MALLGASMVVTYYIKFFRTGVDRHNRTLMSPLLLVAETKRFYPQVCVEYFYKTIHNLGIKMFYQNHGHRQ